MISIVDASDLQYVLRPTVYRPVVEGADRARECHPDATLSPAKGDGGRHLDATLSVAKGSGVSAFRTDRTQEPARL